MKVGAIREMAEKAGRSADEAERELLPVLSPPEDSAVRIIDLASDAGAAAGDAVTIFHGDWDIDTHSLRTHPAAGWSRAAPGRCGLHWRHRHARRPRPWSLNQFPQIQPGIDRPRTGMASFSPSGPV